jgi:hypothetical protein
MSLLIGCPRPLDQGLTMLVCFVSLQYFYFNEFSAITIQVSGALMLFFLMLQDYADNKLMIAFSIAIFITFFMYVQEAVKS